MKISEALGKIETARKLRDEVDAGLPTQTEKHAGGYDLRWCYIEGDGSSRAWRAHLTASAPGIGNATLGNATVALIDRYREARQALDAWERNEGPWPLARTATPERKDP